MLENGDSTIISEAISLTEEEKTPETVEVVAPSNLPEGYALKCMLDGKSFNVIVPAGGVKTGQLFVGEVQLNPYNIPHRRWRDGTCDFCAYGICHPCWLAWCCPFLALGQIQTRMNLNLCGGDAGKNSSPATSNTFLYMAIITVLLVVVDILYVTLLHPYWEDTRNPDNERLAVYLGLWIYNKLVYGLLVVMIMLTRAAIRKKYKIPGTCSEDFCCTCCCPYCTLTQMARHTYNYEKYPVGCCSTDCCCSKTGMSPTAPRIV